MSDIDAFLNAILAEPDADESRLVFADWLDDHGDHARAELIRTQCEAARLPEWHPRRRALTLRADSLIDLFGHRWRAELPEIGPGVRWGDFERGFVASLHARTFADLLAFDDRLANATPLVAAVVESSAGTLAPGARYVPWLDRLEVVADRTQIGNDLPALLTSPLLDRVRDLRLVGHHLQSEGVGAIGRSPRLAGLTALDVGENYCGASGVVPLLAAPWVKNLRRLGLGGGGYSSTYANDPTFPVDGVRQVARAAALAGLEELDLSNNGLGDEALAELVRSPHLTSLRSLNLAGNFLTAHGMDVFADPVIPFRLVSLDLTDSERGDYEDEDDPDEETPERFDWLAALATAPSLAGLECLRAGRTGLTAAGAAALAASPLSRSLRRLELSQCGMDDHTLRALLAADWPALEWLDISDNPLGHHGASVLAESPIVGRLTTLLAGSCRFGSPGMAALAASPHFGNRLVELNLSDNGAGAELADLFVAPRLSEVVALDVSGNHDGGTALAALTRVGHMRTLATLRAGGVQAPVKPGDLVTLAEAFPGLARLELLNSDITAETLAPMLASPLAGRLVRLALAGNPLGPAGGRLLAECPALKNLRELDLSTCKLDVPAIERIIDSPHLAGLRTCSLWGNAYSADLFRRLRTRFG